MKLFERIKKDITDWSDLNWKRKVLYLTLILILGYLLLDWAILPLYTRQYQSIAVPDVIHFSWEESAAKLKKAGLRAVRGNEQYDEKVPEGHILFQVPEPGAAVKKGRRIYLTVCKGFRIFGMPKLIGLSERDARFLLQETNLAVGYVDYRTDDFLPEGVVCGQSLEPGTDIRLGTRVNLTVSVGVVPSRFIVPDVVGKSLEEATLHIRKAGLVPGTLSRQATDELLPSTVISQSLVAGTEVSRGDPVDLVISILPGSQ